MSAPAAAAKAVKFTSAFRLAGLNYLEALTVQTTSLRKVLKEPLRTEALGRAAFKYREFSYAEGKESTASAWRGCGREGWAGARGMGGGDGMRADATVMACRAAAADTRV